MAEQYHSPTATFSFLDTDLCKLTMQHAILQNFPTAEVEYTLLNRTPDKKLSKSAFEWLRDEINKLGNMRLADEEKEYLQANCSFLNTSYLQFLDGLRLDPTTQVTAIFTPDSHSMAPNPVGSLSVTVKGLWAETIAYEVPLLALTTEAHFRFVDNDWNHDHQEEHAFSKAMKLLGAGCTFAEYGTRRRRDYHTQRLVLRGLVRAKEEGARRNLPGAFTGTSNVHLAREFDLQPKGTVGHEWFMGIAAMVNDYKSATSLALRLWLNSFGHGIWRIAPTDTFGTSTFLSCFEVKMSQEEFNLVQTRADNLSDLQSRGHTQPSSSAISLAELFDGVRQDSGDPLAFVEQMREFYDRIGISGDKTIVFSDSLDVSRCLEYQDKAKSAGFSAAFGIGTSFTNDFVKESTGRRSTPLNVVMKLVSINGRPAIKLSDTSSKNSGDEATIDQVKRELGYQERGWDGDNEAFRWGQEDDVVGV